MSANDRMNATWLEMPNASVAHGHHDVVGHVNGPILYRIYQLFMLDLRLWNWVGFNVSTAG